MQNGPAIQYSRGALSGWDPTATRPDALTPAMEPPQPLAPVDRPMHVTIGSTQGRSSRTVIGVRRMENDTALVRLGGICGVLFVLLLVPGIFAARPDVPDASLSSQQVLDYLGDKQTVLLIGNGLFFIFAAFFFLWFLGVLHGMLRSAEGEQSGLSSVALAGGVTFAALETAGAAVEIVHPATASRFENFQPDAQLAFISQALSGWLYSFAWVGMSVLLTATSVAVFRTAFLPRWLAWAGFLAAIAAFLKFLIPLATLALLWILAVSVLMTLDRVGPSVQAPRLLERHS